jgi:hypothetical protein
MPNTAAHWRKRLASVPSPGAKNSATLSPYFFGFGQNEKFSTISRLAYIML